MNLYYIEKHIERNLIKRQTLVLDINIYTRTGTFS